MMRRVERKDEKADVLYANIDKKDEFPVSVSRDPIYVYFLTS